MLSFFLISIMMCNAVCTYGIPGKVELGGCGDDPSRDDRATRNGTSSCSASSSCEPPPVIFTTQLLQQLAAPSADEDLLPLVGYQTVSVVLPDETFKFDVMGVPDWVDTLPQPKPLEELMQQANPNRQVEGVGSSSGGDGGAERRRNSSKSLRREFEFAGTMDKGHARLSHNASKLCSTRRHCPKRSRWSRRRRSIRKDQSNSDAAEVAEVRNDAEIAALLQSCLLYTSPSPRDYAASRMPSSA